MIDRKIVIDQPVKSSMRTYNNIKKKLQQVKEMITQVAVCWIIVISINAIK